MMSASRRVGLAVCFALAWSAARADEPAAEFKAGFAERDITPKVGSEAPGGYGKAYHRAVHDPCKVRAAVFDDGRSRVALVGIDGLFIHRRTALAAREAIRERTGIPGDSVLIGASHSHSAGPMAGVMPGEYDHAPEAVRKLAYEHSTCADAAYLREVEAAIAEAVARADGSRTGARAGVGKGRAEGVAFNRRFRMRDGRTVTHPGQGNPDIVEPAGPTDPEVGVIGAWDARGKLLGCVVNFACHATCGPGGISADYVGYVERAIRGYYGPDAVVVFLNGASGDVTQVDNRSPDQKPDGDRYAQLIGGSVGAEAVRVLLGLKAGPLAPVASRAEVLRIARRAPAPERVEHCREVVAAGPAGADPTEWAFAKEIVLLDAKLKAEPVADVEVQAVQVGPAVFLTTPAEYFCAFGLEQKARSRFPFTFPVSLANGCVGYVPTDDAFGPGGGGYETRLTSYSNLEITAGRRLAEAGLDLAGRLRPGPLPASPRAPAFSGEPWPYGNARPELK